MPAVRADLTIEQGSYEPLFWTVTNPDTGEPLDLSSGFAAKAQARDVAGVLLYEWTGPQLDLTADGRVYLRTPSAVSAGWTWRDGRYSVELTHPAGETVRIAQGRVRVDPEIVTS